MSVCGHLPGTTCTACRALYLRIQDSPVTLVDPTEWWRAVQAEARELPNARGAFYSLAMVGHAVTVGVLAVALNDFAACPVEPGVASYIDSCADVGRLLRAALGDS